MTTAKCIVHKMVHGKGKIDIVGRMVGKEKKCKCEKEEEEEEEY